MPERSFKTVEFDWFTALLDSDKYVLGTVQRIIYHTGCAMGDAIQTAAQSDTVQENMTFMRIAVCREKNWLYMLQ